MKINSYKSKYKDQNAITLESDLILAQFLPGIGSKMTSFVYKPLNIDLLIHKSNPKYRIVSYDGKYSEGESSGFDEAFPTIDECYYGSYPWQGVKIPNHGEAWSLPWEFELDENRLRMELYGLRFSYKLEKFIYFVENNILRIEYNLTNLSIFNFDFMWTANPIFILEEGAEIILPEKVEKISTFRSMSGRLGKYCEEFNWPSFNTEEGKKENINIIRPMDVIDIEKYYIKGRMPEGWCALRYPKSKIILGLSFPVDKVPYLGIIVNGRVVENLYYIIIEPCTATFNRLGVAKARGQFVEGEYSSLAPKSKMSWFLNMTVSQERDFKNIDSKGFLFWYFLLLVYLMFYYRSKI